MWQTALASVLLWTVKVLFKSHTSHDETRIVQVSPCPSRKKSVTGINVSINKAFLLLSDLNKEKNGDFWQWAHTC